MRAGAVPLLALVVVEVSDYVPLVADVSRARIKVCVVHDPRPLNNSVFFITRTHHTLLAHHFEHVDASDLDLWQVSFPIDDLETELGKINLARYPKLSPPSKKLTTFFTDAADDCLHVIAQAPGTWRQSSLWNHI